MRSVPSVTGETQPIIRIVLRLAGAVGPEEAEALAGRDVEVDPVDGGELAEPLGQAAGVDERRGRRDRRAWAADRTPASAGSCHQSVPARPPLAQS